MPRETLGNDRLLQVYITPEQYAALQKLARRQSITLSDLVRAQFRKIIEAANLLEPPISSGSR